MSHTSDNPFLNMSLVQSEPRAPYQGEGEVRLQRWTNESAIYVRQFFFFLCYFIFHSFLFLSLSEDRTCFHRCFFTAIDPFHRGVIVGQTEVYNKCYDK